MFSDQDKVLIRKYCGYPAFGSTPVTNYGYRYSTRYGDLEFRLNNLTPDEENQVTTIFLPNLQQLENDLLTQVRTNVDTDKAAVWYRNKNEFVERIALYNKTRRLLCEFIGAAYGPSLRSGGFFRAC